MAAKPILEKSGGQVRLRGLKYPLPVCLSIKGKGDIRATIRPNTWTSVPEEIYQFLKNRFDSPRYTEIPDVDANEQRPHAPGEAPQMTKEELDPGYYLEFRGGK